jgi:MFS family permease
MGAADSWRAIRDATQRAARGAGSTIRPAARTGASAARWTGRQIHRSTHASGAGRTGLADLIELTAVSSAGDAFIAVALAGTLFFHASLDQARGQVAVAMLVTMAPFALLAPLIGPMLDHVRQGRRYILAGTLLGRGLLCWGMAGAVLHKDPLTLLPSAFAVLVLSKAFGITRSAVTPRLLPAEITLVTANARCGLASLIAATVAACGAAAVGSVFHADWVLRVGTLVFLAATALSLRLPDHVDTVASPAGLPAGSRLGGGLEGSPDGRPAGRQEGGRRRSGRGELGGRGGRGAANHAHPDGARWRTLTHVGPVVGEAMRANAAVRAFSGFILFFLAFLLRSNHFHGVNKNVALGALLIAAAAGGLAGTAAGSVLRSRMPHLILFGTIAAATVITAACAWFFGLAAALLVVLAAAFGQALAKLALDSIVQREIGEEIRSSTFAVSETLHQLAWVAGGLLGVVLSVTRNGTVGLSVAAAALGVALFALIANRRRRKRVGTVAAAGLTGAAAEQPRSPSDRQGA